MKISNFANMALPLFFIVYYITTKNIVFDYKNVKCTKKMPECCGDVNVGKKEILYSGIEVIENGWLLELYITLHGKQSDGVYVYKNR